MHDSLLEVLANIFDYVGTRDFTFFETQPDMYKPALVYMKYRDAEIGNQLIERYIFNQLIDLGYILVIKRRIYKISEKGLFDPVVLSRIF